MRFHILYIGLFLLLAGASACTHDAGTVAPAKTTDELVTGILTDMGPHVITPYYTHIDAQGKAFNAAIKAVVAAPTQANLLAAQAEWRTLRQYWEQSEAFLYGPTETDGFDPDIDTWPVNKADFDSLLATGTPFTMESIAALQPSLKGFHPIEYILFGLGGTRQAAALTARQKEFVSAQGDYLQDRCSAMAAHWDPASPQYFGKHLAQAGLGDSLYTTRQAAFTIVVKAMADICEEVGEGKIAVPFDQRDSTLEESPFSKNSVVDFTDNMAGVLTVYQANYAGQGQSVSDFVRKYNRQLDADIVAKHQAVMAALGQITDPFGVAIYTQRPRIQNAQIAIAALHAALEDEVMPLIVQRVKN